MPPFDEFIIISNYLFIKKRFCAFCLFIYPFHFFLHTFLYIHPFFILIIKIKPNYCTIFSFYKIIFCSYFHLAISKA
ncbi:hypothetical protein HMPREF1548_04256 [Clostridium sp. KLE 1755]|nr:hypothetical protein HMPREF1548_04256 [Clostridium sp. KLE 1755]